MTAPERLADLFDEHRPHVRAVAYRMLGSVAEADDAVQDTWLKVSRADVDGITNLRAWLTTVVARVCLDMLRTRASRREEPLEVHVPDPIVMRLADGTGAGPEADAIRANEVSLALLVVLETLEPVERLALVLHDVFGMAYEEIAPIVDRSVVATRQVASRARRRVQREAPRSRVDLEAQRHVVEAFLAAVQEGDVERLVTVLDPDVVLRADGGRARGMSRLVRGASGVIAQAAAFSKLGLSSALVRVNGDVGVVSRLPDGRMLSVMAFAIAGDQVVEMNILADPDRLQRLDLRNM